MANYKIFVTPKAHSVIMELMKDPNHYVHELLAKYNAELVVTDLIYMNMGSGWTEDECDNVAYLTDIENMEPLKFKKPEFKDDIPKT
jgi:hypothetical protein